MRGTMWPPCAHHAWPFIHYTELVLECRLSVTQCIPWVLLHLLMPHAPLLICSHSYLQRRHIILETERDNIISYPFTLLQLLCMLINVSIHTDHQVLIDFALRQLGQNICLPCSLPSMSLSQSVSVTPKRSRPSVAETSASKPSSPSSSSTKRKLQDEDNTRQKVRAVPKFL